MKVTLIEVVIVLLIAVLLTLAAPDFSSRAIQALDHLAQKTREILVIFLKGLARSLRDAFQSIDLSSSGKELGCWWVSQFRGIWQGRVALRKFFWPLLTGALLLLVFWFSLLVDSRAIELGLEVVFGSHDTQPPSLIGSLFEGTTSGEPAEGPLSPPGSKAAKVAWFLVKPFLGLWERDLGPMALGLATLEGALGLFLFWKMEGAEALRIRPAFLLRERFIPLLSFLLLKLILAVLAGIRGFEIAGNPWTGALLSGGLALSMPWAMAYTLHLGIETPSAILGLGVFVLGLIAMATLGLLLPAVILLGVLLGLSVGILVLVTAIVIIALSGGLSLPLRFSTWIAQAILRSAKWIDSKPWRKEPVTIGEPRLLTTDNRQKIETVPVRGTAWIEAEVRKDRKIPGPADYRWRITPPGEGTLIFDPSTPAALYRAPGSPGVVLVCLEVLLPDGEGTFAKAFPVAIVSTREAPLNGGPPSA